MYVYAATILLVGEDRQSTTKLHASILCIYIYMHIYIYIYISLSNYTLIILYFEGKCSVVLDFYVTSERSEISFVFFIDV